MAPKRSMATYLPYILPSFVNTWYSNTPGPAPRLSSTSALDGLRGLGSLIVFNEHITTPFYDPNTEVILYRWAGLRILWYGGAMVSIFFVMSGFVLSIKPLRMLRQRNSTGFGLTVASSIFRRAIRLYLPTFAGIMIACVLARLGVFNSGRIVRDQRDAKFSYLFIREVPPRNIGNWFTQIREGLWNCYMLFDRGFPSDRQLRGFEYDKHLWTIPIEFSCSMAIFLVMAGVSHLSHSYRVAVEMGLIFWSSATGRHQLFLFLAGMVLAELHVRDTTRPLLPHNFPVRSDLFQRLAKTPPNIRTAFWVMVFFAGIFMLAPGQTQPLIFRIALGLFPRYVETPHKVLQCSGAILVVLALMMCPALQKPFNTRPMQYLGKISYALYIVHGNVIKSLGYSHMPGAVSLASGKPYLGLQRDQLTNGNMVVAFLLTLSLVAPVSIWLTDLFYRYIDIPSVKFARWVESRMSAPTEEWSTPKSGNDTSSSPKVKENGVPH